MTAVKAGTKILQQSKLTTAYNSCQSWWQIVTAANAGAKYAEFVEYAEYAEYIEYVEYAKYANFANQTY